jgi:HK97 gp10 family phage protein
MGKTRVEVKGLRELGKALKDLGNAVGLKIARGATAAGARVVRKQAVANIEAAPSVRTGSLRDSVIVKRAGRGESSLTSEHLVTVRGRGKPYNKKGQRIARAPHAHLVEFGTVNMPAEPFLVPAYEQKKVDAVAAIAEQLAKGIDRAAKKVAAK